MDTLSNLNNIKALNDKISKWDDPDDPLAPLSSAQKDSFLDLAAIASNRPIPIEVID